MKRKETIIKKEVLFNNFETLGEKQSEVLLGIVLITTNMGTEIKCTLKESKQYNIGDEIGVEINFGDRK